MKANAPEKLYLIQHNGLISYCRNNDDDIEYVRKDAFIYKAEGWLREVQKGFILTDKDITDFVNYMKGE